MLVNHLIRVQKSGDVKIVSYHDEQDLADAVAKAAKSSDVLHPIKNVEDIKNLGAEFILKVYNQFSEKGDNVEKFDDLQSGADSLWRLLSDAPTSRPQAETTGDETMSTKAKATKKPAAKKSAKAKGDAPPRKVGVIDEIVRLMQRTNGASVKEIHEALIKKFPERDAAGMLATIRIQVNRAPTKMKKKVDKAKDEKRGLVYTMAQ